MVVGEREIVRKKTGRKPSNLNCEVKVCKNGGFS